MKRLFGILALGVLLLAGCGQQSQTGSISINMTPASLSLEQGQAGSVAVTINRTAYTGNVQLTVGGAPSGVSVLASPGSTSSNTATILITTSSSAPAGSYLIPVTATGTGSISASGVVALTITEPDDVTPPPPPPSDFTISVNPASLTLVQGGSNSATIALARSNLTGAIDLSVSGVPSGLTATLSNNSTTGSSVALSLNASSSLAAGNYTLAVTATSGSLVRTANLALVVNAVAATPDFTLSATGISVMANASANSTISITPTGGYTGTLSLSCSGLPAGISCGTFSSNPVTVAGPASVTLPINVGAGVASGNYAFNVVASSGTVTKQAVVNVNVGSVVPGITLSAEPLSVMQGSGGNSLVTVTPVGGFTGTVALSCANVPTGVTCGFSPSNLLLSNGSTSTLTLNVAPPVAPGTYTVVVQGTSGAISNTTNLTLTVTSANYFTLMANPQVVSRLQGQKSELGDPYDDSVGVPITRIMINRAFGFENAVGFTVDSVRDPAGVSQPIGNLLTAWNFDVQFPPSVPVISSTNGAAIRLFADINPSARTGNWSVRVKGIDPILNVVRYSDFTLQIDAPYTLSLNDSSLQLRQGQQVGHINDDSVILSLNTDQRLITSTDLTLKVTGAKLNGNALTYYSDVADDGYFITQAVNLGVTNLLEGDADECAEPDSVTFLDVSYHSCWRGFNVLSEFTSLAAITVRDSSSPNPLVVNNISNASPDQNPRYLRVRINPEAPVGSYAFTIVGENDGAIDVGPAVPTPPEYIDVNSAGGGIITVSPAPVRTSTVLTVDVAANYYTLATTPSQQTFPDPGSAPPVVRSFTIVPTLVGDAAGSTTASVSVLCSPFDSAIYTSSISPTPMPLVPGSSVNVQFSKNANTAGGSVYACGVTTFTPVPVGLEWWARVDPEYRRVTSFSIIDQ